MLQTYLGGETLFSYAVGHILYQPVNPVDLTLEARDGRFLLGAEIGARERRSDRNGGGGRLAAAVAAQRAASTSG